MDISICFCALECFSVIRYSIILFPTFTSNFVSLFVPDLCFCYFLRHTQNKSDSQFFRAHCLSASPPASVPCILHSQMVTQRVTHKAASAQLSIHPFNFSSDFLPAMWTPSLPGPTSTLSKLFSLICVVFSTSFKLVHWFVSLSPFTKAIFSLIFLGPISSWTMPFSSSL